MASHARPAAATSPERPRSAWRRALNVAIVIVLVVASVAAQAVALTPVAILLLLVAVCALAPLFTPALDV